MEEEKRRAEEMYQAYPRKEGHQKAIKSIVKALKEATFDTLKEAVEEFAGSNAGHAGKFTPFPATWFNQGRWKDDRSNWHKRFERAGDELHRSLDEAERIVQRLQDVDGGPV